MSRVFLAVLTALLSFPVLGFQALVPSRSALERRGLHHATIRGRFLSPGGEPIQGVRVQMNAGGVRALPLVDAQSGADGSFEFRDVNSPYMPDLRWYPPEEWLRGGMPLPAESGSDYDTGAIRLEPNTIIRIAVEIVGGSPLSDRDRPPTVVLQGPNQFTQRMVAEPAGTYRLLREISFEEGTLEVSLFANRRVEKFSAPFRVQRGRRDQLLTVRLLRDTVKQEDQFTLSGRMEMTESVAPPDPVEKDFAATGKVVGPDGSPVAGAFVNVKGLPFERKVARWTATDVQGNFHLQYRAESCVEPGVSYGHSDYWIIGEALTSREPCESRWKMPRNIVVPVASRLDVQATGIEASAVRTYWWHDSFGWQPLASLQPWISLTGFGEVTVKAEADGLLPLIQTPELPRVNWVNNEKPPATIPVTFQFDNDGQRELIVRGNRMPISGATVDVDWIEQLDSDRRWLSGTYRTDSDGRISLKGGADRLVEVFVYVNGFEPRRAIWNPGAPLILDLVPQSATLSFAASSDILARIRDAGSPQAARSVKLNTGAVSSFKLAPGVYDVTVYGDRGGVTRYERISLAAGESRSVDPALDQRPRLTVRYPASGWHAQVSDSTPRGGAVGWAAMIAVGGALTFLDAPATVERETSRESVFTLSRAGRMHVELRRDGQSLSLWRDVEVRPGESLTLDAPEVESTLMGSMRTYDGGLGLSEHGWAGPRMQLISDDPAGWSATEYLPARDARSGDAKDRFTVRGLPAGSYHLYQHLIGTPKKGGLDGREYQYTEPIAAWGGIPVRLPPGGTAQLKDFIDYPFSDLRVRVTNSDGVPIEHATLRIRDRMAESWKQVEENPAQIEQAAHPLPYPAAARIMGGAATLPRVREGWLDMVVELDEGPTYVFTKPVSPGGELSLVIPSGRR
jgi:hypothetical protein